LFFKFCKPGNRRYFRSHKKLFLQRHENIGLDRTSANSCTQLWLVTHFYANGSLYDYLNLNVGGLTSQQAFKILMSSLNGIVHLHTEIFGTQVRQMINIDCLLAYKLYTIVCHNLFQQKSGVFLKIRPK
jgi:serine/threonine protein kinase